MTLLFLKRERESKDSESATAINFLEKRCKGSVTVVKPTGDLFF